MYIPVLLFVVGASYLTAIHVEKCKEADKKPHMGIVIILLLSLLLFFKYYNFAAGIINSVFSLIGVKLSVSKHSLVWPLGISFFTFTAIGYVIDVYLSAVYGTKLPDLAWEVQSSVKEAVESIAQEPVSKVNIHIQGVVFAAKESQEG